MRLILSILSLLLLFYSCHRITERLDDFEVHGIDISHYQAEVDWDKVARQGISFAFMKATEGETLSDSTFSTNWSESQRVGIMRGAYHFFRPTTSALNQANKFMEHVELNPGDLPPVLDVEVTDGVSPTLLESRITLWLYVIERNYNVKPIIYSNLDFYYEHLKGKFDKYPIWIARYNKEAPQLSLDKDWTFWQYGNKGQLEGIDGYVDFNVFNGSRLELEELTIGNSEVISFSPR